MKPASVDEVRKDMIAPGRYVLVGGLSPDRQRAREGYQERSDDPVQTGRISHGRTCYAGGQGAQSALGFLFRRCPPPPAAANSISLWLESIQSITFNVRRYMCL